ncbi:p53 and DNA damage-regulated protein 1 [Dissophora ornata]|nr:p53 and DNA damage-regulated protein 1 [Dissophora ornata]
MHITAAAVEGSDSHSIAVEPSLNSDDRDCDDIKQDERVLCAKGGGEEEEEEGGGGIGGGHGKCMKELRFLLEITEVFQVIRQCILQRSADRINRTRIETEEAITSRFYANEIKPKNPIEALARNTELVAQVKESKKEIEDSRGEIHREEEAAVLAEYGLSATEYAQLGAFRYERNVRAHPVVGELIVDYDRRRNSNREALTKLKKDLSQEKKVWVNLGDLFIKLPKQNVETIIKRDQETLDAEIEDVREIMKEKVVELEKLEGGDGSKAKAFQLKAMTK